ncbi:MAG: PQQ-dependent sugar dehydrogenase [Bacteroidota bacterium]
MSVFRNGLFLLIFCFSVQGRCLLAINLPPEFEDILLLDGLQEPASIAFSPDGRLFFGERISGRLRVAKQDPNSGDWIVEAQAFYTFNVPSERHRSSGIRGFTFDPDFANNGYVYVFYMRNNPRHNRVVRIQADPDNPDVALADSETLLIDLPFNGTSSSGSHNGGDIAFGGDGKLYFTTGDGWNGGDNVQSLATYTGKVFRINADGSIPIDNPFYDQTSGSLKAIYALGLRNPYTIAVHPETGDVYINEARGTNKADIYRLRADGTNAAANFSHDGFAGLGTEISAWTNVATAGGKLVTGGAWYPADGYWPAEYHGNYLVALWGGNGSQTDGRINRVLSDEGDPTVSTFATNVFAQPGRHKPVMCKIGPDGNLYYLLTDYETGNAQIHLIRYTGVPTAAAPVLDPPPGQYDDPIRVGMRSTSAGAAIYYSLDGSTPTAASNLYEDSILINESSLIRAIAIAPGLAPSPVNGGQYWIGPIPNTPPVADAGPDLLVEVGQIVTLNGAASYDPDGSPLEIVEDWIQVNGPPVTIQDADETVANFTPIETGIYEFQIQITDIQGATDVDNCLITVVEDIPDVLDALVARWRMEAGLGNTLLDYSPNSNQGIVEGAAWDTETTEGSDFSLRFDGVDDRVAIGNLDLTDTAMAITFWFKADDFETTDARFISKANGQFDEDHLWMVSSLNGQRLRFRLNAGGNTTTLISEEDVLIPNQWMHVAAVYDGSNMRLYLDGEEIASQAQSGAIGSDPAVDLAIGNQPAMASGGARPFDGLIDEMRIYGRGLSAEEIEIIRQATALPVEWLQFEAFASRNQVQLNWQTATESSNWGFFVERSWDGQNFEDIGFVPGQNLANANYTFFDDSPINGRNYYRLRQLDFDGQVDYSPIREVYFRGQLTVEVFPNPCRDELRFSGEFRAASQLQLYDQLGRQIRVQNFEGLPLIVEGLAAGSYRLLLFNSEQELLFITQFIKEE